MTQFSELSNEVEDSYMQWKEGKRDQGYYGMKNEASYRNIDLNIPMQRQVDDVQQACGRQSFERENRVCDKNK